MQSFHKVPLGGNLFSSKIKTRGMLSRLLEYILQQMLTTNFYKIKVSGGVCIFKIVRVHSFTGASKTHFSLFEKKFELN